MPKAFRVLILLILAVAVLMVAMRLRQGEHTSKAYTAQMRVVLRTVAAAQSSVRDRTGSYAADLAVLGDTLVEDWPDVSITIDRADSASWRATAHHVLVTQTCWIEGTHANGRGDATQLGCGTEAKLTPLFDSVRAGLAPRRQFKQWLRER